MTPADTHRKALAQDRVADLRRLDRALANNAAQIQAAVATSGTTLTTMHGIGPVLAAKILGHTGDIRRFPTRCCPPLILPMTVSSVLPVIGV